VIVAWFVEALKAPVRFAFWMIPAAVVVTPATVGYVRHRPLVPFPGAVGFEGFEEPELPEPPPHAPPTSTAAMAVRQAIECPVVGIDSVLSW